MTRVPFNNNIILGDDVGGTARLLAHVVDATPLRVVFVGVLHEVNVAVEDHLQRAAVGDRELHHLVCGWVEHCMG